MRRALLLQLAVVRCLAEHGANDVESIRDELHKYPGCGPHKGPKRKTDVRRSQLETPAPTAAPRARIASTRVSPMRRSWTAATLGSTLCSARARGAPPANVSSNRTRRVDAGEDRAQRGEDGAQRGGALRLPRGTGAHGPPSLASVLVPGPQIRAGHLERRARRAGTGAFSQRRAQR